MTPAQNQSRAKKPRLLAAFFNALLDDMQWTQHILSPIRGETMTTEQRIERLEQTNRRYREGDRDGGLRGDDRRRGGRWR